MSIKPIEQPITLNYVLSKELKANQEVCEPCQGTGIQVVNNLFYETATDAAIRFTPHFNQSLSFCQHCYNGVVTRCEVCKHLLTKGATVCSCQLETKRLEANDKRWQTVAKMPFAEAVKKYKMFYVESFEEYVDRESFNDWLCSMLEDEPFDVNALQVYGTTCISLSLSATDILEQACSDLHESVQISETKTKELQDFLDNYCASLNKETKTYYADYTQGISMS